MRKYLGNKFQWSVCFSGEIKRHYYPHCVKKLLTCMCPVPSKHFLSLFISVCRAFSCKGFLSSYGSMWSECVHLYLCIWPWRSINCLLLNPIIGQSRPKVICLEYIWINSTELCLKILNLTLKRQNTQERYFFFVFVFLFCFLLLWIKKEQQNMW